MRIQLLTTELGIRRLPPDAQAPDLPCGEFVSITRTAEELSIVGAGRGFRCFKLEGPLDFSLVGVLASISAALAKAGVPIFAISTHDTDYILVGESHLERAIAALEQDGHIVRR
ncbi:MAG TPA: ACT domain-containing protein [Bryobacteraceae bacterium]|nr:ACT domain-containing protein [Bryobacteraceae bacterium]